VKWNKFIEQKKASEDAFYLPRLKKPLSSCPDSNLS
jgi:hypothetical protein